MAWKIVMKDSDYNYFANEISLQGNLVQLRTVVYRFKDWSASEHGHRVYHDSYILQSDDVRKAYELSELKITKNSTNIPREME